MTNLPAIFSRQLSVQTGKAIVAGLDRSCETLKKINGIASYRLGGGKVIKSGMENQLFEYRSHPLVVSEVREYPDHYAAQVIRLDVVPRQVMVEGRLQMERYIKDHMDEFTAQSLADFRFEVERNLHKLEENLHQDIEEQYVGQEIQDGSESSIVAIKGKPHRICGVGWLENSPFYVLRIEKTPPPDTLLTYEKDYSLKPTG